MTGVQTCALPISRNESGIRSSGGILRDEKGEMIEIDGLTSSERCRLDECLRTGTSPDWCPYETWFASNICGADGSGVGTHVASEVEGSVSVCRLVFTTGTSAGSDRWPAALCEGRVLDCPSDAILSS